MQYEYRNDALHPTLRRAHPLAQRTLEMAKQPSDRLGACDVLESDGAGGLTDFTMGGTVTGEAWSLNPYSGCQHACSYCYVPDTIRAERQRWGSYVIVKRDLPRRLALAMQRSRRMSVYLSTATDPYQPAERTHRITRRCLEALVRKDWPVEILTRSPLVLRDLDLLRQLSQVRVGLSVPMLDDAVRRVLEPNAPPVQVRLRTLRTIADEGIPTYANYTPACPPTTHDAAAVARTFLDAGVQWVNSKGWQRVHTTMAPVWERLRGTEWEWLTRFFAAQAPQEAWHQELGAAFGRVGLPLGTPFYNPPVAWTTPAPPEATRQVRLDGLHALPRLPVLEVAAPPPRRAPAPQRTATARQRAAMPTARHRQVP